MINIIYFPQIDSSRLSFQHQTAQWVVDLRPIILWLGFWGELCNAIWGFNLIYDVCNIVFAWERNRLKKHKYKVILYHYRADKEKLKVLAFYAILDMYKYKLYRPQLKPILTCTVSNICEMPGEFNTIFCTPLTPLDTNKNILRMLQPTSKPKTRMVSCCSGL